MSANLWARDVAKVEAQALFVLLICAIRRRETGLILKENGDVDLEHTQVLHVSLIFASGMFLSLPTIEGWNGRRGGEHPKSTETCYSLTFVSLFEQTLYNREFHASF